MEYLQIRSFETYLGVEPRFGLGLFTSAIPIGVGWNTDSCEAVSPPISDNSLKHNIVRC